MDPVNDPLAGTPYRALDKVGQGGMGEVLEAEHRALRRRVVVKLLHSQFADDPRFADRLRVEAQALAAVSSPHVVAVSDLSRTPLGRPYLVMERLQGRTLRDELERRGPLPVAEAITIVRQVLAGLGAAHRVGIIHRDVKLDNVFLAIPAEEGEPVVKVLDFGIAKVLDIAASPSPLSAPKYPTEDGVLVGSPRTCSPEQARFLTVDARTDVYAAGLLLYTLLVGESPFARAADILELLNAHIHQAPTPPSRAARQYIPPELDLAILRALAKRPEDRFQSAELFAEELGRVLAHERALAMTSPPASSARPPIVEATAQGTVVMRPPASPPLAAWSAPPADAPYIATLPANLAPPSLSVAPGALRRFALITLVSTVVFSLIAALLVRYWEAHWP